MFYKFELGNKAAQTTKNIFVRKFKGAFDLSTATR